MHPLLKKLNFKTHKNLVILNAPNDLDSLWAEFTDQIKAEKMLGESAVDFALVFCTKLEEVIKYAALVDAKMEENGLFWFAYPKGSSKKYKCEFNRDNGWQAMGDLGYEPVRMVAVDDDWSALRFRKTEHIKTMTRGVEWRMSEEGKKK
jgi:hypothetical protein